MKMTTLAKHVISLPYHNQLSTEMMMTTPAKDAMLVPYSTYPQDDDYSSKGCYASTILYLPTRL